MTTLHLRLEQTPMVLNILADQLENNKAGWREKLFQIDSYKTNIFQGSMDSPEAAKRLRHAVTYQKSKGFLIDAKEEFTKSNSEVGQKFFKDAISYEEILHDRNEVKVTEVVYKEMWEQIGKPQNTPDAGKNAFASADTALIKKIAALQKGIDAIEAHWSSQVLRDVPQDMFGDRPLNLVEKQSLETLQKESGPLKERVRSLEQSQANQPFWVPLFKWIGITSIITAIGGLFWYIFKSSEEV
ncbi:MAG: hypothetical protein JSR58_05420 [Verrucomicrobia bacterium]|nr:hypothetical protein [Verrucomicrobiota bacterium]